MIAAAIIGGVAALGSAVMGLFGASKTSNAIEASAEAQLEASKIGADVNKQMSDQNAINNQFNGLFGLKEKEFYSAGMQTGALVIGIVIAGVVFVIKR
jgi:hypothetical protein